MHWEDDAKRQKPIQIDEQMVIWHAKRYSDDDEDKKQLTKAFNAQ